MMQGYTLSVRLMTYNHEPFIAHAIESVFMQKANFKLELIIGDDFSTDNTINIINRYKSTNNIKLNILSRKAGGEYWKKRKEIGRIQNFYDIISHCKGKYIALLDGDDYWTDCYKLQKQVDFLEANSEYSMCFHNALKLYQNEKKELEFFGQYKKEIYTQQDIIHQWLIPTASVVFRNIFLDRKIPEYFYHLPIGDFPLFLYLGEFGKYRYMDEPMSVYRVLRTGETKTNLISEKYYLMSREMSKSLQAIYKSKFRLDFAIRIAFDNYCLARFAARKGERRKATALLLQSLKADPLMMFRSRKRFKYITLRFMFPKILRDILRGY